MIIRCTNLTWVYLITALSVWVHTPSSLAGETEQTNVDRSAIDWEVIDIVPEEITEGDWTYAVLNNEADIIRYDGPGGHVVIPRQLANYPVTGINRGGRWADVVGAFEGRTDITSLHLPDSIRHVGPEPSGAWGGSGVFEGCAALVSIIFPASLTWIEVRSFKGCDALESIVFLGSAPGIVDRDSSGLLIEPLAFEFIDTTATVYYLPNAEGWGPEFGGRPALALVDLVPQARLSEKFEEGRIAGRGDVTNQPASFGLYTKAQFDANRSRGREDLMAKPSAHGLVSLSNVPTLSLRLPRNTIFSLSLPGEWTRFAAKGLPKGMVLRQKQRFAQRQNTGKWAS